MALTTRAQAQQNFAKGLGYFSPLISASTAAGTNAATNSGFLNLQVFPNSVGTTLPSTLQTTALPPGLPAYLDLQVFHAVSSLNAAMPIYLAYLYKIGTMAFTGSAPLDVFTHDAATFPLLRTQHGAASQPVNLIPLLYVTTAAATSAPAFLIQATSGPGAGYVNQAANATGSNVIGNKTFTCPTATTAAQSCYVLRLNEGDSAVQDIIQISLTTAASAGAATIYGMEILCALPIDTVGVPGAYDAFFGGLRLCNLAPAVATSGSATSVLCLVGGGAQTTVVYSLITGVLDQ